METKTITISLDKAREWFNSGNYEYKQLALQVFSEEELATSITDWREIKSFESACKALGLDNQSLNICSLETEFDYGKHLVAIYKLDIIRRALNRNWNPSLTEGNVFFPIIRFFKDYDEALQFSTSENFEICGKVKINNKIYTVVGGEISSHTQGLSNYFGYGDTFRSLHADCQSEEIAQHISKYFAKEIFDAMYAQFYNYEWL